MRKNVRGVMFHAGSECWMPMWQTGCCRAWDCFLELKDRGASDEASRFLFLNELMECFGGCSLLGGRVGDGSLSSVVDGWLLCSAVSPHRCLLGRCSAVRWPMQRAEMTDAACCIFLSTFPGNPRQSALISPPAYSSTQINQPSHRHRLSSAHLPAHVPSLTSTSYVLMKLILLPQQARSSSSVCTLVFLCLHAHFPQPAHLSSSACTLVFHCLHARLPLQKAPVFLYQSACHHTARAFAFPRQHDRLPQPGRSASTTRTFGFLCQHVQLLLPEPS